MKSLWWIKLTRPIEEEKSIEEQLKKLSERTKNLRDLRDKKKEGLQKYQEEAREEKDKKQREIQGFNAEKANYRTTMDKEIENLNKESAKKHKELEESHIAEVAALKKKIDGLEANLLQLKLKNKTEENKLREENKRADRLYTENLNAYDIEMKDQTR